MKAKLLEFASAYERKAAIKRMAEDRMQKVAEGKASGPDAVVGLQRLVELGHLGECVVNPDILITAHHNGGPWVAYACCTEEELPYYQATGPIADCQYMPDVKEIIGTKNDVDFLAEMLTGKYPRLRARLVKVFVENFHPDPEHVFNEIRLYRGHGYPFVSGLNHLDANGNAPVQINWKERKGEIGCTFSVMGNSDYIAAQEKKFDGVWNGYEVKKIGAGFIKILGIDWDTLVEKIRDFS